MVARGDGKGKADPCPVQTTGTQTARVGRESASLGMTRRREWAVL
jgi:hypothetical protein